ncbi:MAG: DUF2748 family protein [Pseudomonadota bacterium]
MTANQYHLLAFIPATEAWEMPPPLEALAQALVASGKLRIHADAQRNYVRYGSSGTDKTFTQRELTDPKLAPATRSEVARHVAPAQGAQGIADVWDYLLRELKKARGISLQKELRVARVLVQSAHPSVIQLLLQSGTELFISYSHNVAELMAVHEWENLGTASGLQATETTSTAVYVSAGGDPFFEGEHKTYVTDGFPALARMVVIAGQELGHFADLRRGARGILGRHSTDAAHSQLRASPIAGPARIHDQRHLARLAAQYDAAGLRALCRAETAVAFYHARLRYTPPWMVCQLRRLIRWARFTRACKRLNIHPHFTLHPYHRHGDAVARYLADMAFNLAPDADIYRNADPLVEEAIIVLEAVARVPQQVHKWGHDGVAAGWPKLYRFYYGTIIPACQTAAGQPTPDIALTATQRLRIALRRHLRKRPDYYPS